MNKIKYSKEFKLEVIEYYKNHSDGVFTVAKHFGIPSRTVVVEWIKKYEKHGIAGLENKNPTYDGKFRIKVVEYMHKNKLSCTQTAIDFNLSSHTIVSRWDKIYQKEGPQALLKNNRKGLKNKMISKNQLKKPRKINNDNIKDLIEENERLRMENAYLKKLQALIQKRTKPKQ